MYRRPRGRRVQTTPQPLSMSLYACMCIWVWVCMCVCVYVCCPKECKACASQGMEKKPRTNAWLEDSWSCRYAPTPNLNLGLQEFALYQTMETNVSPRHSFSTIHSIVLANSVPSKRDRSDFGQSLLHRLLIAGHGLSNHHVAVKGLQLDWNQHRSWSFHVQQADTTNSP